MICAKALPGRDPGWEPAPETVMREPKAGPNRGLRRQTCLSVSFSPEKRYIGLAPAVPRQEFR
jgi:hypothetical protein